MGAGWKTKLSTRRMCRSIDVLEENNLSSLNDLKNVLSCHFEYMGRSFFKTRNSRRLNFHVVFLMVFQFRGARLALGIAKVSFLVTYIHINLLSIIISCTYITSNEKVNLYVNENLRGHVHNLKLTADRIYSSLQMTTLKFLQNGWQDGEQEKGNL